MTEARSPLPPSLPASAAAADDATCLVWPDEAACARAAGRLALAWADAADPQASSGTLTLEGPLGAGKTAFSRHLLRALGVRGAVRSPTYSLVEPYSVDLARGPLTVVHCDFYRFENPAEWEEAGLRELFASAQLRLVEWPARAEGRLGPVDLALRIEPDLTGAAGQPVSAGSPQGTDAALREADGALTEPDDRPPPRCVRARAMTAVGAAWLARLRSVQAACQGEGMLTGTGTGMDTGTGPDGHGTASPPGRSGRAP